MGGECLGIEAGHARALLDDPVDGAGLQRPCRNIAPAVDFSKHAALGNPRRVQPAGEGFDGTAGQIDDFVVIGATGFGAAEMDAERGEGEPFSSGTGGCLISCSMRKPATSLRRRPPEAKASIRIARSRKAVRSSPEHVASSWPRISPVMAWALLRRSGRFSARTARRIAALTAGDENAPSRPRQRSASTSWPDAAGRWPVHAVPTRAKALSAQGNFHAGRHAVTGVDLALLRLPQMMRDEFQQQGFGRREGQGLPVAASAQASR